MQQSIADSELIITAKGTIYHIDLAPEQLADTIITVGDPDRVSEVSKYFDRIEHKARHREFITHTGYIGHKRLTVIATGIGPDNIDIVFNELDALANIDFNTRLYKRQAKSLSIIRLGTCGSLQPDIPTDSIVASTYGIGLDNLLHYYRYSQTEQEAKLLRDFVGHTGLNLEMISPYIATGSEELFNHFTKEYTPGITVTCPGFYGPQGRTLRGPLAFPGLMSTFTTFNNDNNRIINLEMETAAIYGLGRVLGHRCLSLSTVVNNRILKTTSGDPHRAIDKMIRRSLEIIEGISH